MHRFSASDIKTKHIPKLGIMSAEISAHIFCDFQPAEISAR